MQIKSLALAAVAIVAVNAQSFANNTCTQCVFSSFPKDTECAKLPPTELAQINTVFANNQVNVPILSAALQKPGVKACFCSWSKTAFTPAGAAGGCIAPTPNFVCSTSQIGEATSGLNILKPILNCDASVAPPTASGSGAGGAKPSDTPKSAANGINMPYVLTVAAFGLVALVGL